MVRSIITLIITLFISGSVYLQQAPEDKNANKELYKVLSNNIRYPRVLVEKNQSSFFTLKIKFGGDKKIKDITASKYAPKEVIKDGTNPENYKTVNWEAILKEKPKEGDILIIPISIYSSSEQNTIFYEYTLEDAFNYNGNMQNPIKCMILQPVVLKHGPVIH
ncbi:hypothetical protein [Chitinophaga polysaccharea]|uniref:hypothetical protein n=1 Tax=Chitinophaga polysaccharea TaxID=1293035 RepID=UPI001158BF4B|nr:hypothetical protein [Chitinophaga polysaccharea]